MILWFYCRVWFFDCGTYWNWKRKIPCFAPESMAVLCGMFYTWKAQISNLLSKCKQIIEVVLKLKDYCFFSFGELKNTCRTMLLGFMQKHAGSKKHVQEDKKQSWIRGGGGCGKGVESVSKHDESTKVIHKVMPCWAWVQPSFDASSAPGCCPQSHEILLNKGMKYWDSGLNVRGLRTFIATAHVAAAVIGWRCSLKEMTGQTQLSTKFAPKLSFMPRWNPVNFVFPVFWNLIPYVTKQGVFRCHLFLTLRISLLCPQISAPGLAQVKNDDQQFW
jgi:hypothetical protein